MKEMVRIEIVKGKMDIIEDCDPNKFGVKIIHWRLLRGKMDNVEDCDPNNFGVKIIS